MMLEPHMADLLKQVPSRYQLVNVVAHRAREIAQEAEDSGEILTEKPVTLAARDVAAGIFTSAKEIEEVPAEGEEN